jgi:adenylate cyclase
MVGYSRLMEKDEEGTLARQKKHRKELIDPTITSYHGRIVKSTGDGLLVEFPSVVDAFRCAVSIQLAMPEREAHVPEAQRIAYRIGINSGDIVIDGDDIYGDGVNIAARLEAHADAGGICVSRSVFDQVKGKVKSELDDLGAQRVKNIAEPIQVYHVRMQPEAAASDYAKPAGERASRRWAGMSTALAVVVAAAGTVYWISQAPDVEQVLVENVSDPLPDKLSIAVLPFANISGDPEQDYFSDGFSEDIITDLSRVSNLRVIDRNSSFSYKGKAVKVQEVSRDLGVHYVLQGSIRKSGKRIRITTHLADARDGTQLWAERYDREQRDIFDLQDEIAQRIIAALLLKLGGTQLSRIPSRPTRNFEAYDLFLRGQESNEGATKEDKLVAQEFYRRAIGVDPTFGRAYGAYAVSLLHYYARGWSEKPVEDLDRALELARKAVELNRSLPQTFWALGYTHMHRREWDEALAAVQQALTLAPNYADGYRLLALINNRLGRADEAIELIHKAMKLNPYYTWDYPYNLVYPARINVK